MKISEQFSSIQGEGLYTGVPAIFLRLSGCNLMCGEPDIKKVKNKSNQEEYYINKSSNAKWVCDTLAIWQKGEKKSAEELYKLWEEKGYLNQINNGAHIVLTGGEPLLNQKNEELITFLSLMKKKHNAFIELETNGTILPDDKFISFINHINCSPKLSNSGIEFNKRINPEVLKFIKSRKHSFKFVVKDINDVEEITNHFIKPLLVDDKQNIFLMPSAKDRQEHILISNTIIELCIKHGLRYSARMHIIIWDQTTGV